MLLFPEIIGSPCGNNPWGTVGVAGQGSRNFLIAQTRGESGRNAAFDAIRNR